ncbi:MAG: pitrilysin family protein [Candidatus Omnitrophota bacterium]
MYKKTCLNNGLTILTYYMPNRVSVSLGVWIKVGARYEAQEINGISHFLEHLVFKGTKTKNCEQIKQTIEGAGGTLNGFTSEEVTCYLAKVPAKYIGAAVDVLADLALNAELKCEDIETERRVILEEIRMYNDLPSHLVMELLIKLLWPNQSLGRHIAGEAGSVSSIDRAKLLKFQEEFYSLNNITVVACGNVRHDKFVKQCRTHFASGRSGSANRFTAAYEKQAGLQLSLNVKQTEQTYLALGLHGFFRGHPDYYGLEILHILLGANMSSRLFREVREKRGLAYEIGTSVRCFQDAGAFIVHAGADNQRIKEVLQVVIEQLREIKTHPVEKEELNRAKEYYIGQLRLGLEETAEHMLWLGESFVSLNKVVYPRKVIRAAASVTAQDIMRIAGELFKDTKLNLALIGPLRNKEEEYIKREMRLEN